MKFTYTVVEIHSGKELHVTVRPEEALKFADSFVNNYIVLYDNRTNKHCGNIKSVAEWEEWMEKLARDAAWKPKWEPGKEAEEREKALNERLDNAISKEKAAAIAVRAASAEAKSIKEDLSRNKGSVNWDPFADSEVVLKENNERGRVAKAVDPPHYRDYIDGRQWIETMQEIPSFRDPERFKAALELQIRKYLDRNGKKDNELQELSKALWYMKFLVAYIKNDCKPIRVDQIDSILLH